MRRTWWRADVLTSRPLREVAAGFVIKYFQRGCSGDLLTCRGTHIEVASRYGGPSWTGRPLSA